jgi:uncharacterized protein (DUF1501 family)
MLNRRQFLTRTLQGTSLIAVSPLVPQFLLNTAHAAEAGKDTVLVVVELTGGNDGLNTVIPYGDDLYHKARPTLHFKKEQVVKVDDHLGLHPNLAGLGTLLQKQQLAIIQGVGYPNPDRSHFESMDYWQSAEIGRKMSGTGWLARAVPSLQDDKGGIPAMQVGPERLPLTLQGAASGVVSVNNKHRQRRALTGTDKEHLPARKKLLEDLGKTDPSAGGDLAQFVQRRQAQTYTTLERLDEVLRNFQSTDYEVIDGRFQQSYGLNQKMQLISQLIMQGFGTRIFYVQLDGFDTHSKQAESHKTLLNQLDRAVQTFFQNLENSGQAKRVLLLTFSEFGRRVQENGSKGTDHGAASCQFLVGPAVKAGPIGAHPSLSDLDSGDLKFHTDFRRVYATLLDQWLHCDSEAVLGGKFEHIELLKKA